MEIPRLSTSYARNMPTGGPPSDGTRLCTSGHEKGPRGGVPGGPGKRGRLRSVTNEQEHTDADGDPVSHASYGIYDWEAGTVYVRQWPVPLSRAEELAAVMTERFGAPADGILRIADIQLAAETAVVIDGDAFGGGCTCGEGDE